jgi:hypothetical protein
MSDKAKFRQNIKSESRKSEKKIAKDNVKNRKFTSKYRQ